MKPVALTAALVTAFSAAFLSPGYDNAVASPPFHAQGWELYCSPAKRASIVAPRGHAKSTAFTHDFVLAAICFRARSYVLLVSATEDLAIGHLGDIAQELRENDDLRAEFGIVALDTDAKTDCIVRFADGHRARILIKGSGQKMRGVKWMGRRPDLILCDDLEDDDQVENIDRRRAFRRWFTRTLLPIGSANAIVRVHGTILHDDALLARLQRNKSWATLFFAAHRSYSDFSAILWPEMFSEARLRDIQHAMEEQDDSAGYSQEYLNAPLDLKQAFLAPEGFLPLRPTDWDTPRITHIGCDFAVSKRDAANRTSFTVGGATPDNSLLILDQHVDRWDTSEWIDLMFDLERRWSPDEWTVEGGVIWNAVWPVIRNEMQRRGLWMNFRVINPVKDKAARALALKKRHRAGAIRYNTEAPWYDAYKYELQRFTATSDAVADDQFDSTAILVKGFEEAAPVEEDDFLTQAEEDFRRESRYINDGRDAVTGY